MSEKQTERTPLKRFSITVAGWEPETFDAVSASAARYKAFKAFTDAAYRLPVRDFLARVTTLHLGKVSNV